MSAMGDPVMVPTGQRWCPIHGNALCPEEYMLRQDEQVATGYSTIWNESLRCGKSQPVFALAAHQEDQ